MTEKRFEFIGLDNDVIKDNVTGESHWAVEYEQRKRILDLLNEQEEEIQELKQRNQRQYNRLKELTELMYEKQWGKLENMVDEWEKADELLEQEWSNCGDE